MTEVFNESVNVGAPELPQAQDVQTNAPNTFEQQQQEKMIPQSQVGRIAAQKAREVEEKTAARYQSQIEQLRSELDSVRPKSNQDSGNYLSREEAQRLAEEKATELFNQKWQEKEEELEYNRRYEQNYAIAQQFASKIENAIKTDPEFKSQYEALNLESQPDLIVWLNSLENTTGAMKELASNPSKYANVLTLASRGMNSLAMDELRRLDQSIKINEEAKKNAVKAPEPLGQLKPSLLNVSDGKMSVADLRRNPLFRG